MHQGHALSVPTHLPQPQTLAFAANRSKLPNKYLILKYFLEVGKAQFPLNQPLNYPAFQEPFQASLRNIHLKLSCLPQNHSGLSCQRIYREDGGRCCQSTN